MLLTELRGLARWWLVVAAMAVVRPADAQNPAPYEPNFQRLPDASTSAPAFEPAKIAQAAYADGAESEVAKLARRVAELEQAAEAAKKPDEEWTDLSQEKWTVKLGGHVQADFITWANSQLPPPEVVGGVLRPTDQNYFEFRRLRLVADGTGYGQYDFRLQATLESETQGESQPPAYATSPDVKDAYFSINEIPLLGRFRIGNFFVPFGLEQVTNDTNNIFLERSIPTQGVFTFDREVGVAFYNCTESKNVTWTTGVFIDNISDTLKERIDDNQGYRVVGRATWLPYYDEASNGRYLVHTGAGIVYTDDQDNSVRIRARPQIHEGPRLIDTGNIAAPAFTTANVEFATVWANITVQSEAFLMNIEPDVGSAFNLYGTYVHVSYFLTGENRIFERFGQHGPQFGRNQPFSNFFAVPGCFSLGAIEAKARWSYLDCNEINRGEYNDFTAGFNWYLSDRVRVMFDWIHPMTTANASRAPLPGTPPGPFGAQHADILATRFDFNW